MPALRLIVGAIGLLLLAGAVVAAVSRAPIPIVVWLAAFGLTLTVGGLFERVHYKLLKPKAPAGNWIATPERFVDPTSGRMVQVHLKPETGERVYVDAGPAPPHSRAERHFRVTQGTASWSRPATAFPPGPAYPGAPASNGGVFHDPSVIDRVVADRSCRPGLGLTESGMTAAQNGDAMRVTKALQCAKARLWQLFEFPHRRHLVCRHREPEQP